MQISHIAQRDSQRSKVADMLKLAASEFASQDCCCICSVKDAYLRQKESVVFLKLKRALFPPYAEAVLTGRVGICCGGIR